MILDSLDHDAGLADDWGPLALLSKLIDERIRPGLSQAEVAIRMGFARSAVAKLENHPNGVAFSRVLAYARALGVELTAKTSRMKPKARTGQAALLLRSLPVTENIPLTGKIFQGLDAVPAFAIVQMI